MFIIHIYYVLTLILKKIRPNYSYLRNTTPHGYFLAECGDL